MNYVKMLDDFDEIAKAVILEVKENAYNTGQQICIYVIGRINERMLAKYSNIMINTDVRWNADLHEIEEGTTRWSIETHIRDRERQLHYPIKIKTYQNSDNIDFTSTRPQLVVWQAEVEMIHRMVFNKLTGDASLSSSEFIETYNARMLELLQQQYGLNVFDVSLQVSHLKNGITYTAIIDDLVEGYDVTFVEKAKRHAVVEPTVPLVPKDYSRSLLTVELSTCLRNLLGDIYLKTENETDTVAIVNKATDMLSESLTTKIPDVELTYNVVVQHIDEHRIITVHLSAPMDIRIRSSITRKVLTPTELENV